MIEWLVAALEQCRTLGKKASDAKMHLDAGENDAAKTIGGYMKSDYETLVRHWKKIDPEMENPGRLHDLARHIRFGENNDYDDIIAHDLPSIQETAEKLAREKSQLPHIFGFEDLLHQAIKDSSLSQYGNGHLRDAVLNGVIAVFDLIRIKTGLKLDGKELVGQAFGMEKGKLIFTEVDSESGKSDQKGFLQIYEGFYIGVRNVKAHSLQHDLDERKAAQYLVALSLLARRVEECKLRD